MIDIYSWLEEYTKKVEDVFPDRVWFIGIQGSYGRGEATEKSDIDVVLILDKVSLSDLKKYRGMLDAMPRRELACGFVSGKDVLMNWSPFDLVSFYYDTTPIKGSLAPLLEKLDNVAIRAAVKNGACGIYHACTHNFVHEKDIGILKSLYKSAVFTLQAIALLDTGKFCKTSKELEETFNPLPDVLKTAIMLKRGEPVDFDTATDTLLIWATSVIENY